MLQDSLIVLNDCINLSKPFFITTEIEEDGRNFLKNKDNLIVLRIIKEHLNKHKTEINRDSAKEILSDISKKNSMKKTILMKSLRVALFGCLSGPDLIQSWELLAEKKEDFLRIERCLD